MKFIRVQTLNRSSRCRSDAAEGLDLLKRAREARPLPNQPGLASSAPLFHLDSLFTAVELLAHLEFLGCADGFEVLIGKLEPLEASAKLQFRSWLLRRSVVYHVGDLHCQPIIAEDRYDFDRTVGLLPPLQTIDRSLLGSNRPLLLATTQSLGSSRSRQPAYVDFNIGQVTQELLQTAAAIRSRWLDGAQIHETSPSEIAAGNSNVVPFRSAS